MKGRRGRRRKYRDRPCIDEEGRMSLLPDVIVVDILSRLPMKTILQCRCVCKTWQRLILDSYFASLLQREARPTLVLQSDSRQGASDFYMVEVESGRHGVMKFNTKNNLPTRHVELLGSCNGFLCLFALNSIRSYYLCNPITGQYVNSPSNAKKQKRVRKLVEAVHGFGFDPRCNQYIVLRIIKKKYNHPNRNFSIVGEVYTFGTENWRSIGELPFPVHHKFFSVPVNGALHWIAEREANRDSDIICSLNIDTKKTSTIATPYESNRVDTEIVLGVLKDCLYICDNLSVYNLEIWLLKNYGVESSWTKEIVISKTSLPKELQSCVLKLIMMLKDGEILIQSDRCNYMILYDTRKGSYSNVSIGRVGHKFTAAAHVASFDAIPGLTL